MGVKHVPKWCLPDEHGLTHRSISAAKGKRRRTYVDPYAGGKRSGKHAKPDARVALPLVGVCYAPWLILCHVSIFSFHLAHMCTTSPLIRLYRTTSAVAAYLDT